ncbi:MAG: hypothetical protein QHJ34_15235 [bacterium]|jgi:hypothetical protein|nr:hypothetical protein [candidate division KSB1 bacterium]MDH7561556.1 hypothetical protein [bacterium]
MRKSFLLIVLSCPLLLGAENPLPRSGSQVSSHYNYFAANRISCSIHDNGTFARHPTTGNSDFSLDGVELICTSGIWVGALVDGQMRVSSADFVTDFCGGAIGPTGEPFGRGDSTFRVYKISRGDSPVTNPDYAQWPIAGGAPSDEHGNPLLLGDQTLWCSFVDSYPEERSANICAPLGAEVHLMVWGWREIDNIMFLEWKLHNRSSHLWQDCYIGAYADPDVGMANNDLVASDSTLSLVYAFDAPQRRDPWERVKHAVGYQMLQSPLIPSPGDTAFTFSGPRIGYSHVPVYSPRAEKHVPHEWADISYQQTTTALEMYRRLRCLATNGEAAVDPSTGRTTTWATKGILSLDWGGSIMAQRTEG